MITLLVPTKDRVFSVKRLLRYYADVDCPYSIFIGDSSREEAREEIQNYIRNLKKAKSRLSIEYFSSPQIADHGQPLGWGIVEAMCILLSNVKTPYVVLNADDDFLNVRVLKKSVTFLENNHDYSAAHGVGLLFSFKNTSTVETIKGFSEYPQRMISYSSAAKRLLSNLTHYNTIAFAVQRTHLYRENWKKVKKFQFDRYFEELFNSCSAAIQGKFTKLDQLHMVRQTHEQMGSMEGGGVFRWILSDDFSRQSKVFVNALGESLAEAQKISTEEAREFVRKAFWAYLSKVLGLKWKGRFEDEHFLITRLKKWARKMPFLKETWEQFYSFSPWGKCTLPALLKKTSPYHEDFMSIYRTIQKLP